MVSQALRAWKRRRRNMWVYPSIIIFPNGLTSSYFLFAWVDELHNFLSKKIKLCKFQVELDPSLTEAGDGDGAAGQYNACQTVMFAVFFFHLLLWLSTVYPGEQVREDEDGEGIVLGDAPRYPWDGTDRDYKYEEVFDASLCNIICCPIGVGPWWYSEIYVNSYKNYLRVLSRTGHPWCAFLVSFMLSIIQC
jgi:hypothetical protein